MNMKRHRSKISISVITCFVVCTLSIAIGCNTNVKEKDGGKTTMASRDINAVKEAHTRELMALPGVVGVYVGELDDHTPAIGVMVVKKMSELEKKIPKTLEGYPVKIDETGEIKPMR